VSEVIVLSPEHFDALADTVAKEGAVNFRSLCRYGLADVSDPRYVPVVDEVFAVGDEPMCATWF